MFFKIITIGKIKNKNISLEIDEIKKRISRFEIIELKEIKDKNPLIIKKKEYELFSKYIDKSNYNVLLWEHGSGFSTTDFYEKVKTLQKPIVFFITGPYGPNDELKLQMDLNLSLSKMTFTHEIALFLLVEQIYRVFCIESGIPYSK